MDQAAFTMSTVSGSHRTLIALGMTTGAVARGDLGTVITNGPIDPVVLSLGPGAPCAVGWNADGIPVRSTDVTCVSAPNWVGTCTNAGAITVAPWRSDNFNVIDFGADPTGVIDATPAFVAAMRAVNPSVPLDIGGTVFIPLGTFRIAHFKVDRPSVIEQESGGSDEYQVTGKLLVTAGESGIITTIDARGTVLRNLQIESEEKNMTSGVGTTVEDSYTLTMSEGAENFQVGQRIRAHGSGWRNTHQTATLSIALDSEVITVSKERNGLYPDMLLNIPIGFTNPVKVISIDPADTTKVTVNQRATATASGIVFDYYGEFFTEIVAKDGNAITMLSMAESSQTDTVIDHAESGIVLYGGTLVTVEQCSIGSNVATGFRGPNLVVHGNHADLFPTNANLFTLDNVFVGASDTFGVYVDGIDANAGYGRVQGIGNRLGTICDDSFLGNTWEACHTSPSAPNASRPFHGYWSRDNAENRSLFVGCYIESGSSNVFGRTTNTLGGNMDFNPGGHAWVDGTFSDLQVGDIADYSLVQTALMPERHTSYVLQTFQAKDQRKFYFRKTGSGDGAVGYWMLAGASAAAQSAFLVADLDNATGIRVGSLWMPFGFRIGGGEDNGTLDATHSIELRAGLNPTGVAAGTAGDVVWNRAPTVGQPTYWVCTVTGGAGAATWVAGPLL